MKKICDMIDASFIAAYFIPIVLLKVFKYVRKKLLNTTLLNYNNNVDSIVLFTWGIFLSCN